MIRINLLPTKRKKKAKPMPMYLVYAGITFVLSMALLLFVHSYMSSRIKAMEKDKTEKTAELKRLNDLIKHVKDFEAKKADLQKRISVILGIAKKKVLPPKLVDEISKRLTDGIWLTAFTFKGDKVKLAGVGFNNADIVTYVEHLKDTGDEKIYPDAIVYFTEVKLHGTQKVKMGRQAVYRFTISMKANSADEKDKGAKR